MSLTLKRLYVDFLRERYQATDSRKRRAMMLDQLCRDAGYHRKHAIRALNQKPSLRKRRGRKRIYSDGARYHLRRLWLLMEQMNGRRMKKMLPRWIKNYEAKGYDPAIGKEILSMGHATIERILKPARAELRRRIRSGTVAAHIKNRIPIKVFDRNVAVPGYLEADTVAHCGGSMSGEFLWSLTATDRLSGWTEVRSVWNKLATDVVASLEDIENSVPFTVKGLSTDNGTEFLNNLVLKQLKPNSKRATEIFMTRSRPYKKNDQCYVEQKNYTHVRKLLGYDRIDCPLVKELVNDLYRNEWSDLQNYFLPQMKLVEKIRVGAKYKRKYDDPQTPFERLMKAPQISDEAKQRMQKKFDSMNPFEIKARIEHKLQTIWAVQRKFSENRGRLQLTPGNKVS